VQNSLGGDEFAFGSNNFYFSALKAEGKTLVLSLLRTYYFMNYVVS
jgi:hypothetical protein